MIITLQFLMHTSILNCLNNIENLSSKMPHWGKNWFDSYCLLIILNLLPFNCISSIGDMLICDKNVSCIIDGGMDCYNTPDSFCCLFRLTGKKQRVLNLGSYNYLGFSQNEGPCAEAVEDIVHKYGVGTCASRQEMGTTWFLFLDSLWSPIKIQD